LITRLPRNQPIFMEIKVNAAESQPQTTSKGILGISPQNQV